MINIMDPGTSGRYCGKIKPKLERAIQLAYEIRKAAERYKRRYPHLFDKNLCGLCGIGSMALTEYLNKNGIRAKFIMGRQGKQRERLSDISIADHCWVEVPISRKKNLVIDITMTQFGDYRTVYLEEIEARGAVSRGYKDMRYWGDDRATPQTTAEMLSLIDKGA